MRSTAPGAGRVRGRRIADTRAQELFAEDLRLAQRALGEITGEFTSDDLLGKSSRALYRKINPLPLASWEVLISRNNYNNI